LIGLPASTCRVHDQDLTVTWQSRLNIRLLEHLEGQKLALRARTGELKALRNENDRKETLLRGYVGGTTWQAIEETLQSGGSIVNERRQELTMCFCDLVGFTSLSERLHPSEVAGFLNDHFSQLHDIVRAHAGWVDKFIGDAMLAIFDNPTEAMSASMKMVKNVRKVRVTQSMEQTIQLRVGLNTGIVAVASLGVPEKRELTVLGDAVNLAQRLQSSAPANAVMLSSRTFSRLPFAISRILEPLEISVKGKKDPVQCYLWTVHSDRRQPDKGIALRENLLTASRRTSLSDRLRGGDGGPSS
jgi:class 3 adenylate cyclase